MAAVMLLVQFFMIAGIVLTAAMVCACAEAVFDRRSNHRSRRQFAVSAAYLLALLLSGIVWWQVLTAEWPLSFWTTLKASVDSATYGHAVEHAAEKILVWTEFLTVACGLISAVAAFFRVRPRFQQR